MFACLVPPLASAADWPAAAAWDTCPAPLLHNIHRTQLYPFLFIAYSDLILVPKYVLQTNIVYILVFRRLIRPLLGIEWATQTLMPFSVSFVDLVYCLETTYTFLILFFT